MLSETFGNGLAHYEIGPKIRALPPEEETGVGSAR